MKLVILAGPHAVGKMTVGQALARQTGLKLFHNHMTIDVVCDLFDSVPEERARLTALFREEVFRAFVKTGERGMIFTYMWAFDCQEDWDYLAHVEGVFAAAGAPVYYVELEADRQERWRRNTTENRLLHKPSKRDTRRSAQLFEQLEAQYRLNSLPGEVQKEHYLRIDNTNLTPQEAAERIRAHFSL